MLEISLDTVLFIWVLKVWLDVDDDDEDDGENDTVLGDNWISVDDDLFEFLLFLFDSAELEEEDEDGDDWFASSFIDKTFTSCAGSFLLRNWSMPLTKFVIDFLVVADSLELFFSFRASFSWVFLRRKNL